MSITTTVTAINAAAWAEWHALLMGLACIGFLAGMPTDMVTVVVVASFSVLILIYNGQWTPGGRFGLANTVTLLRFTGILVLFHWFQFSSGTVVFALGLFALDGADGWIARKLDLVSEFGEYFDKEVDAVFLLILALLIYADGRLGLWVLIPGLLRYLFVIYLKASHSRIPKERRTRGGRGIYCLTVLAMISALGPWHALYPTMVGFATILLGLSFADSVLDLHRQNSIDG